MAHQIVCESGAYPVPDISKLGAIVEELLATTGDAAYWLHHEDEAIAGFLYNGEHATVFRCSDGAEPFNPNAPDDETTLIRLENGQLDAFYLQKCIAYDDALAAFISIANNDTLPDNIQWI